MEWEHLKVTIISVTQPPVPLLNKKFMTYKNCTYIVPASDIDNFIPGVIGDFQCASELDANLMSCKLSPNVCICHPQDSQVTCSCQEQNFDVYTKSREFILPLDTQGMFLYSDGKSIKA